MHYISDHFTNWVAGLAVIAVVWPWVGELNQWLSLGLGLLGCAWLLIQIYYKIKNKGK